ncbi:uncharacterized protein M6B38_389880 [Iris pallida]|uniref:Uncharacterized protein n=1 Tax=Iris pallida TaxID=29817 RepID=A0AAX6G1Z2_IRIPA|nr:uncharacterized protein M6B38_389880 [Iris pallida]
MKFILALRRSNFAGNFPEIRPLDRRFLRSVTISIYPPSLIFAGPTSSACISSTAAPFGVLPVPVQSWTLWLQWDLLYLSAVQVIEANSLEVPASLEETH